MANCTDLNYLIYKECNLLKGQWNINVNSTPLTNIVFSSLTKTDSTSKPLLSYHLSTPPATNNSQKNKPLKQESSLGIQLGHFLKVYSDALTVKQNKVNVFQRGAGGRHKMVGDSLEDELGGRLLWESVPVREIQVFK